MQTQIKWQLKRGVEWVDTEGNSALFFHFGNRSLITGQYVATTLREVFNRLQQALSVEELQAALSGKVAAAEIIDSIRALDQAGFLVQVGTETQFQQRMEGSEVFNFLERFYYSRAAAIAAFRNLELARICVLGLESGDNSASKILLNSLAGSGFQNVKLFGGAEKVDEGELFAQDSERDFWIVMNRSWLNPSLTSRVNGVFLRRKKRWLNVIADDFGGVLGPFFGIANGPCFDCLYNHRERHLSNLDKYRKCVSYFENRPERVPTPFSPFMRSLAEATCLEVLKLVADPVTSETNQGLIEFDYLNHRTEFHRIFPAPFCETCRPRSPLASDWSL